MTVSWVTQVVGFSEAVLDKILTDGLKYAAAFGGALALSLLLTPVCRELARKLGMIDKPDARRINRTPIPRGGGLSVFLAFHVVLLLVVQALGQPISQRFSSQWQASFLLASTLLALIGFVDDKCGMRPLVKLAGQILVATILFLSGVSVGGVVVEFPAWLDYAVTVFWIVGAVNAFNLIDGMDGLASGLALIASLGLAGSVLFTGSVIDTLPYLVLAGACLGFLRYNFHPASVFLGDTGSMFLGLCLATLPLVTGSRKELVASLGVPLLAMGIPIFDTLLAIWRRTVRALLWKKESAEPVAGTRVMQPDKDHIHHRLLRETMSQRTAAIILYCGSVVLVTVGLAGTLLRNRAPGLFLIAFVAAIVVVVRHLERVELWDTGRLLSRRRATLRQGLLVPFYILVDVFSLCAVWFFTRWMLHLPLTRAATLAVLPMFIVPVFVFLVAGKTYSRVWSRAQVRDFAVLALAVFAGAVTGAGMARLFGTEEMGLALFALVFAAVSVFPLAGVRLWKDCVGGLLQVLERRILMERPDVSRVLAVGGGLRFRSFLREMMARSGQNDRLILGVIDDDLNLKGRLISGFSVLGTSDDLEHLVQTLRIDALVITYQPEGARLQQLVKRAEALGVGVSLWVTEERPLCPASERPTTEGVR